MAQDPLSVLFLCTHNSARSILAEALLNRLGLGRFKAYSAGSHPAGKVSPFAKEVLDMNGFSTEGLRSKSWNEFARPDAPRLDLVVTVCDQAAGELCPIWPGQPLTAHWGIEDPSTVRGSDDEKRQAFFKAYRRLQSRLSVFVNLPIQELDRTALMAKLDEIGRLEDRSEE